MLFSKTNHGYIYRWIELSTGKWYIGSRSARRGHVNDGYICSSKIVKPLIQEHPENWIREILFVGEMEYIRILETEMLLEYDAAANPMSYNQTNSDGKFHTVGKRPYNLGKKMPEEQRLKMVGTQHTAEAIEKMKNYQQNRPESVNKKISESKIGSTPWNKGIPRTKEEIDKMSIARKETAKLSGAWNKGIPHTTLTKQKISNAITSIKKKQCVFCGKEVDVSNFGKWHGDNCIKNPDNEPRESYLKYKQITRCEYCGKSMQYRSYVKRHGDNCKHKYNNYQD